MSGIFLEAATEKPERKVTGKWALSTREAESASKQQGMAIVPGVERRERSLRGADVWV